MGASTYVVRPPVLQDAETLGRVHCLVWQATYVDAMSPSAYAELSPDRFAAGWRRRLEGTGAHSALEPLQKSLGTDSLKTAARQQIAMMGSPRSGWCAVGRFFDVQDGGPLRLELRSVDGRDFTVLRQIGYDADGYDEAFTAPADPLTFATDLASVPPVFTWLVPRIGLFLPAAVLHDAMTEPEQYIGPRVDRPEADLIFREAMIGLGTGKVRAALMWSAVTVTTMWKSPELAKRAALVATIGIVTVLGVIATLDLFDVWNVLPWMGERSTLAELGWGAAFAVVVPSVLSMGWGKQWAAGLMIGIALALLLHVTLLLGLLYLGYVGLERLISGPPASQGNQRS
ncbi:hypothetical protein BH23ACT6_BH23ACT6_07250 [soil metagenome]